MVGKQLELFEGQEISITTDKGIKMINLANSARVLGLTTIGTNGNLKIRWKTKGVSEKLTKILECTDVHQKENEDLINEITYILDEIENTDDRTSIYCSRYLTSRLAMECHNQKATEYKDWLAKLDEKVSEQYVAGINTEQMQNIAVNVMNSIVPVITQTVVTTLSTEISKAQTIVEESNRKVEESHKAVEDIKNMIGSRNKTTQVYGKKLIARESEFYGRRIYGTSIEHRLNKDKVFNHFNVVSFDDIPIVKFDEVINYIETMELIPKEIIEAYYKK